MDEHGGSHLGGKHFGDEHLEEHLYDGHADGMSSKHDYDHHSEFHRANRHVNQNQYDCGRYVSATVTTRRRMSTCKMK